MTGLVAGPSAGDAARYARNRGFVTDSEQAALASSTVAIAGVGGDGGRLAVTLARMGIGGFHLADPESFAAENLNRQEGSTMSTLGRNKAEVIAEIIAGINPGTAVTVFPEGLTEHNLAAFLSDVALVVDEIEYSYHWLSVMLARACRTRSLPVAMGLNVGFGCLITSFMSGSATLEEVLGLDRTQTLREIRGREVPLHRWVPQLPSYIDPVTVRAVERGELAAPSVAPGVDLASGCLATEAFNHITGRKEPILAPEMLWVDALERAAEVLAGPLAG